VLPDPLTYSSKMFQEIQHSADFLVRYLPSTIPQDVRDNYKTSILDQLEQKFSQHWNESYPSQGNAVRAVSIFSKRLDPILQKAALDANIKSVENYYPAELVLWTDPFCCSFRVGEYGYPTTIYATKKEEQQHENYKNAIKNRDYSVNQIPSPPNSPPRRTAILVN
jgi:hypothetical protein